MSTMHGEAMDTVTPEVATESGETPRQLFELVYDELRKMARRQRRRAGGAVTLDTTALVHEAYLKLAPKSQALQLTRAHFLSLTARVMRQVLIDHARSRLSLKRGGEIVFTQPDEDYPDASGDMVDVLALNESLIELASLDARASQVVEWHVFGGLGIDQIAEMQGLTERTVYRDWRRARAFLVQRLDLTLKQ